MARILLLGPNRWPHDTADKEAGLKIRREIAAECRDLEASWILMEDDRTPGDPVKKFLALATDRETTHVFLVWPRDCKMAGTEDVSRNSTALPPNATCSTRLASST